MKVYKDQAAEIYVLGGRTDDGDENTVWIINIEDQEKEPSSWVIKSFTNMTEKRSNCKAFYD